MIRSMTGFGRARAEAEAIIQGFMESAAIRILATSHAYFGAAAT